MQQSLPSLLWDFWAASSRSARWRFPGVECVHAWRSLSAYAVAKGWSLCLFLFLFLFRRGTLLLHPLALTLRLLASNDKHQLHMERLRSPGTRTSKW